MTRTTALGFPFQEDLEAEFNKKLLEHDAWESEQVRLRHEAEDLMIKTHGDAVTRVLQELALSYGVNDPQVILGQLGSDWSRHRYSFGWSFKDIEDERLKGLWIFVDPNHRFHTFVCIPSRSEDVIRNRLVISQAGVDKKGKIRVERSCGAVEGKLLATILWANSDIPVSYYTSNSYEDTIGEPVMTTRYRFWPFYFPFGHRIVG